MSEVLLIDDPAPRRLDLGLWRRIARHVMPYRRQVVGLGLSGAALAAIDVLLPYVTGLLIDASVGEAPLPLAPLVAAYGVLVVGIAACVFCFIRLAGTVATGVGYDMRRACFARLQSLSFAYFDARPTGWLVSRLTSDVNKVSGLTPWFALDIVWGSCLLSGIVVAMFVQHAGLALVVLLIVPPLVIVTVFFQRRLLESSRLVRRTNSVLTANYSECLMGVRTTKALAREHENLEEFGVHTRDMERYSLRHALQSAVYLPLVVSLGSLGVGLALWRGGFLVQVGDAQLSPGELVAFMQYAALFSMPIQDLARRFTDLQAAQAAAERIQGLLDEVPEIADGPRVVEAMAAQAAAPVAGRAPDGGARAVTSIVFDAVEHWYKPQEPVLRGVDLEAPAGKTVALVGPTGGGKTTIVSLAARFYEPRAGAVLVDGVDYRERSLAWYQSRFGAVLQVPHLFSGSIMENIRYGRLDATDDEVEEAARRAGAHGFIVGHAEAYQFEVGEEGARLSTGQRQLLALARAIVARPDVLVLDEATSSIDAATERAIQSGIDSALDGRIAFVIAHRLSTIERADEILFVEGGRIVERGTHADLLGARGKYWALVRRGGSGLG